MRTVHARIAACLAWAVVLSFGCPAASPAAEPSATPAKTAAPGKGSPEEVAAKIDAQVAALQEKVTAIQNEETQITIRILQAQKAAMDAGKIEDVKKVREYLANGKPKPEWREYRQFLAAAAQQWEIIAQNYGRAAAQLKPLEKDRDKASPEAQAQIDALGKRLADKRRALVEKAANCYYDGGECKKALPLFAALYQEIPEDKRKDEKTLTTTLADVYDKTGDFKTAVRLYEGLYRSASEADRQRGTMFNTSNRLATIYFDKLNDYKAALEFYKYMLENIGLVVPEQRSACEKMVKDRIAACEAKLKTGQGSSAGSKSATNAGGKAGGE